MQQESPLPVLHRKPPFAVLHRSTAAPTPHSQLARQLVHAWRLAFRREFGTPDGGRTLNSAPRGKPCTGTVPWPSVVCPFCCKPCTTGTFHDRSCQHRSCSQLSNYSSSGKHPSTAITVHGSIASCRMGQHNNKKKMQLVR